MRFACPMDSLHACIKGWLYNSSVVNGVIKVSSCMLSVNKLVTRFGGHGEPFKTFMPADSEAYCSILTWNCIYKTCKHVNPEGYTCLLNYVVSYCLFYGCSDSNRTHIYSFRLSGCFLGHAQKELLHSKLLLAFGFLIGSPLTPSKVTTPLYFPFSGDAKFCV